MRSDLDYSELPVEVNPVDTSKLLSSWVDNNAGNFEKLYEWLKVNNPNLNITDFIDKPDYDNERKKAIRDLRVSLLIE